jgi:hypothetical protein
MTGAQTHATIDALTKDATDQLRGPSTIARRAAMTTSEEKPLTVWRAALRNRQFTLKLTSVREIHQ